MPQSFTVQYGDTFQTPSCLTVSVYVHREKHFAGLFTCKGRQAPFTVYESDLAPSKSSHVIIYASSVSRISNADLSPLRAFFL